MPNVSRADILRGKILVVDDQAANVMLLEQMLGGAGYESVMSTTDPTQVCELHLRHQFDLILLDLQMPGMDGFQVMENLKEVDKGDYLPVLVITAQPGHKLRALTAGARDFVSKPLDLAEVLIRVYNMLEVRLLHLQTKRLYARLQEEQKVSQRLLNTFLPAAVAERLKSRSAGSPDGEATLVAESDAEVAVLFADIVEFTNFSQGASAGLLVGVLNDISDRLSGLSEGRGAERTEIIGDAYLAAVQLPKAVAEHTITAAQMALNLSDAVNRFNVHSRLKLKVSIGVDAGGTPKTKRRRRYDL